jgi:hypothetical protein
MSGWGKDGSEPEQAWRRGEKRGMGLGWRGYAQSAAAGTWSRAATDNSSAANVPCAG